eukprot:TRINITY_DN80262_c0_g1_i1.p1 TRINITY_DN80262_c0_g1~~TRINITY_DN80262_c0_g1_i1.p1  ORF type:complete len:467 (-),score=116.64 TRINITY_DN80262_c0_g1_i1:199-1599(-)
MTTPVQTWGALGNMLQEQKDFGAKTAEYLENYEVYDLFGQLLRQVIVERPENPIKFLQECLKDKPKLYVCVIGPPGINRSKYCQQLATDMKVKHIHVGKMLRARKELKDTIEAGELVADDIVIDMVKDELKKVKHFGWVLDGFPRTKIQAQALEAAGKDIGTSLDTVLLLNGKEEVIRARYEAKVIASGFALEEKQTLINTRLQQYKRHVLTLCEVFQNVVRHIQVPESDDDNMVYTTMKNSLHYRAFSNAPLRMLRICIIGPCASGRTTQCQEIAKTYGVVHIDLADLLRKKQEAHGLPAEEIPPEYLSDEDACALVGARLRQADCVRKGWVLDGFPKTKAQAEFLRQAHQWPSRVIRLNCSDPVIVSRIANRRLDPVTGMPYYKSPNSVVIRQRLVQCDYDMPEKVAERIKLYTDNVERVAESWRAVNSQVQAEAEPDQIFNSVCQKINNALPFELAQDPSSGL